LLLTQAGYFENEYNKVKNYERRSFARSWDQRRDSGTHKAEICLRTTNKGVYILRVRYEMREGSSKPDNAYRKNASAGDTGAAEFFNLSLAG
jgi:hypothetical protein